MRVQQLSAHMRRHCAADYDVTIRYVGSSTRPASWLMRQRAHSDTVFLFSKYAFLGWRAEHLAALRDRCRALLVDCVDLRLRYLLPEGPDVYISNTHAGAMAMAVRLPEGGPRTAVVYHNYDAALDGVEWTLPTDRLRCVYLGSQGSMAATDTVAAQLQTFAAPDRAAFIAALAQLARFNAHYAARPPITDDSFAPFTKGATAARIGAPLLIDRQTHDAVHHLGDDYPFLLDDLRDETIDAGWAAFSAAFGTPIWAEAQDRMRQVADRTRHAAICAQLHAVIQANLR